MRKSNFAAMILGTVSVVLFAMGMCMAMIPECGAFRRWNVLQHDLGKNGHGHCDWSYGHPYAAFINSADKRNQGITG